MTGGDDGLPGIPRPDIAFLPSLWNVTNYYYFTLFFFVLATALMYIIVRSPFGLVLTGIRENELRMRTLGYNVWLYKYICFIIAGFFAGLAGILFVYYNGFVHPSVLSIINSAQALIMVLLGGAGTLFGPALGASIIIFLQALISAQTERWILFLGTIYVLVVFFMPRGLFGVFRGGLRRSAVGG